MFTALVGQGWAYSVTGFCANLYARRWSDLVSDPFGEIVRWRVTQRRLKSPTGHGVF